LAQGRYEAAKTQEVNARSPEMFFQGAM